MNLIQNLEWRYATKKFDANKKVSIANIELLKKAIQLSASSYGLQPYKILIVEDEKTRKKLQPLSWNQEQIVTASHLFVFCNYTQAKNNLVDEYISAVSKTNETPNEDIEGYSDFIKTKLAEKSPEEQFNWTKHQVYIALANLLNACAELKIDACPIEGFESENYNQLLGLSEKGLNAAVITSIGYRSENDTAQGNKKVRKSIDQLFDKI
ncbi:NAD(P)H-dependent oxidoreductase [Pseudotamlana agarivorans]|uniref:NAD(P)H-dependent oxidoreductase n=1 Tax=Pseudotamlana agarivorans TaxID=481183 RepID=UPI00082B2AC2|nr:NAD(P)H-dependent oxidoreductase [Tamlana agarivorans]